ncbi:hypothetical protein VU07_01600 [Desulfobulbus sp. F4]|nr:hypothetical protein [Desulfobulbus sp. F3]MCW5200500.1 hypothetical protein [Desulfobulbus sp. F4]
MEVPSFLTSIGICQCLRQPRSCWRIHPQEDSNGGDHVISKQVNNYGLPPEVFEQYVSELGLTDSALACFFKILEE